MPATTEATHEVYVSEEEAGLWSSYRTDPTDEHRNRIAEFYHPWLRKVAARFEAKLPSAARAQLGFDDLLAVGMIALLRDAIPRYDPQLGNRFATYAMRRVQGAMLDECRRLDPVSRSERAKQKAGEVTPPKLVSVEQLGTCRDAPDARDCCRREPPANTLPDCDVYSVTAKGRHCKIRSQRVEPPDAELMRVESVLDLIKGLQPAAHELMRLYYLEGVTMKEIGKRLGVSESRISQLHKETLAVLRQRSAVQESRP